MFFKSSGRQPFSDVVSSSQRRRSRRQFEFERLEERQLMAADAFPSVFAASEMQADQYVSVAAEDLAAEDLPARESLTSMGREFQPIHRDSVMDEKAAPSGDVESDLKNVDVVHLGGTPGGPLGSYIVSVVGTGAQGQLTSWKITDDQPTPSLLADSAVFDGDDLELTVLSPAENPELARRPFLLGRIGQDGNLWLDSYHLSIPGNFVHDDTRGFGSNAGVTVLEHATAHRPAENNDDNALVVTPVIATSASGEAHLRVVTWQVDVNTQSVHGLMDSGPLDGAALPAADGELNIEYQTGGIFVVNYVAQSGELVSQFVGVADNGAVINAGAGESGYDFDGDSLHLDADQAATAPLGPSSYVTAVENDGEVDLSVWERRLEGCFFFLCSYEPYMVGHNDDDTNPFEQGMAIPEPVLEHAYESSSSPSEHFSHAISVGDFNGDGYEDVAVGAPDDSAGGQERAGAVTVIYGSVNGLYNSEHNWTFSQDTPGIQGVAQEDDLFGYSLAAGDFNGDGYTDLGIGVPGETIEAENIAQAGVVQVLYGGSTGLTAIGDQLFIQGEDGLGGIAETADMFGFALAAGDFDNDGYEELAIGTPQEDLNAGGHTDAGAVQVIYGATGGLTMAGNETIHQNTNNTLNSAATGDEFGYDLEVGDFNGDGFLDLAVGVPGEAAFGMEDAGAVQVFRGSNGGLTTNDQFITQDGVWSNSNTNLGDISDSTETGDRFGQELAAGDFNGDGLKDLAIGAPHEDLFGYDGINHGRIHVLLGSNSGITPDGSQLFDQATTGIATDPEPGSRFGFALTAGDSQNDGYDELLVGIPHHDSNQGGGLIYANSGVAILMRGTNSGLAAIGSQKIEQGVNNIGNDADPGDYFGYRVAMGDLNGDGFDDAVIGVLNELNSVLGKEKPFSGSIHVVYSDADGLTSSDKLWAQGTARHIRAMVSNSAWERDYGVGAGTLYELMPSGEPDAVHVASVTKTLTLLMTVEALEAGLVSLDDAVDIGSKAGTTGGSKMDPNLEEGDIVPLETLLYGMMISSGNRASVAIGRHVAVSAMGAPDNPEAAFDVFVDGLNELADSLGMNDTQVGHPAGGMVSTPQDLITLWREGWRHSLFRRFSGANISHEGQSLNGDPPKEWDLNRSSSYIGHDGWKGGHGRVGSVKDDNGETISVPRCTQCHVGQATRADQSLIVGIQQSRNGHTAARQLYDYGFQRLFTPDHRGHNDYTSEGPILVLPGSAQMGDAVDFAIDHVTDNWSVSAVIDGSGHLQLVTWNVLVTPGTIDSLGGVIQTYTGMAHGVSNDIGTSVDVVALPTAGTIVGDYLTGTIAEGELRLDVWRLGAESTDPWQYLPGDYNKDFVVNQADYTIYRDTVGSTTDLRADGNDSGVIDDEDYQVWRMNYGATQSVPKLNDGTGDVVVRPYSYVAEETATKEVNNDDWEFSGLERRPSQMDWIVEDQGGDFLYRSAADEAWNEFPLKSSELARRPWEELAARRELKATQRTLAQPLRQVRIDRSLTPSDAPVPRFDFALANDLAVSEAVFTDIAELRR